VALAHFVLVSESQAVAHIASTMGRIPYGAAFPPKWNLAPGCGKPRKASGHFSISALVLATMIAYPPHAAPMQFVQHGTKDKTGG
jgi:hypothetical protein